MPPDINYSGSSTAGVNLAVSREAGEPQHPAHGRIGVADDWLAAGGQVPARAGDQPQSGAVDELDPGHVEVRPRIA